MQARYEYGAMGDQPAVTLTWYQGTNKPEIWTQRRHPAVGERRAVRRRQGHAALRLRQAHAACRRRSSRTSSAPAPSIPKSVGHHAEWIHACKTGSPTTCPFAYSGWLTEANHLGNVAYRVGKKLEWDAEKMRVTNAPEAEPFITRAHTKGWALS